MSANNQLFTDGGCIGLNPSKIGGTWAFRLLDNDVVICERSGIILQSAAQMETVSNNLTEMLALVNGLEVLPVDWVGTVYSDSQITLERAFSTWKWNHIPDWLIARFEQAKARLTYWNMIDRVLLEGHPTRKMLERGMGHKYPVSEHNVACDKACNRLAKQFMENLQNAPF